VYGEREEIVFPFFSGCGAISRDREVWRARYGIGRE